MLYEVITAIGKSRGGWSTKVHLVAANARTAITLALSPGQAHDAPQGRDLLAGLGPLPAPLPLLMDSAYEDDQTRQLALDFGWIPVVPARSTRLEPWEYDRLLYRRRNEVERLFRRLKGFRRIFSRFDKLDVVFLAFLHFALIVEALRYRITSYNVCYTKLLREIGPVRPRRSTTRQGPIIACKGTALTVMPPGKR